MFKIPDPADIRAAEFKLVAAQQHTADSAHRLWSTVQASLVRPSSLATVAAVGFCGGMLLGRPRAVRVSSADQDKPAVKESFTSLALAFALRHALQVLPAIARRMWTERREGEPRMAAQSTVITGEEGVAGTP